MQAITGRKQKDELKSQDTLKRAKGAPIWIVTLTEHFTDHLTISPSTHTGSLSNIPVPCQGGQGEADSPKPGPMDSSSACRGRGLVARRPVRVGS